MNVTVFDLLIFLKKQFIYCLIIVVVSFSGYYAYSTHKDSQSVLTFEVDLREWDNLNETILVWLENYKNYPNEIKYSVLTSFDSGAACRDNENVLSVMFCTVEGSKTVLDEQYLKFDKKTKDILKRQLDQITRDINYFQSKIKRTKEFILDSSESLQSSSDIKKLTDFNYIAFNQISQMETELLILEQVYESFRPLSLVKNKNIKEVIVENVTFYSFLCSMLCLFLYVIIGLTYQVSKKE